MKKDYSRVRAAACRGFFAFAAAVLLAAALPGCSGAAAPRGAPLLAVLGQQAGGEAFGLSNEAVLQAAEEIGLQAIAPGAGAQDLARLVQEQGVNVLAVQLSAAGQAEAYLQAAGPLGLPVVFFGVCPPKGLMESYDKCWYIGASALQQGEALGQSLLEAYHAGGILDLNADHLLQVVLLTRGAQSDLRAGAALRIFENYGIYSDLTCLPLPEEAVQSPGLLCSLLAQQPAAELLLAVDPALGELAAEAGSGLPVGCFGEPEEGLQPAGEALFAAAYLPRQQQAAMVAAFAQQAALGQDPAAANGVRLDEARGVCLPCSCSSFAPQPQPTPMPELDSGQQPEEGQDDDNEEE